MTSSYFSRSIAGGLFASVVLLCGCGDGKVVLPKSPVSGKVSYAKSFPEGEVIFKHPSGEITVAKFEDDGEYKAEVPQGQNLIMVRSQTSSLAEGGRPGAEMEVFTNHIPMKYGDFTTSKLELDVKEGDNQYDIKLVD